MLARLNIHIQDQDNFSFDPTVKQEAYDTVVNNDPYVFIPDIEKSFSTSSTVNSFELDDTIEDVFEVRADYNANGYPTRLGSEMWEYLPGAPGILYLLPGMLHYAAGKALWIYVKRKLQSTDIMPSYLQGYILELAAAQLIDYNIKNKVFRFLHNDTTLAELQAAKRETMANAMLLRKTLPNVTAIPR